MYTGPHCVYCVCNHKFTIMLKAETKFPWRDQKHYRLLSLNYTVTCTVVCCMSTNWKWQMSWLILAVNKGCTILLFAFWNALIIFMQYKVMEENNLLEGISDASKWDDSLVGKDKMISLIHLDWWERWGDFSHPPLPRSPPAASPQDSHLTT